jgi:hypothetical protein
MVLTLRRSGALCWAFVEGRLGSSAAAAGASERVNMSQTGHRSADMVRRYIREGSLFRGEWTDLWNKNALL